jgi:hypothetical protein
MPTGTVAVTEALDTLAASGWIEVTGTLARLETDDTLAGIAAVEVTGTLAETETDDTLLAYNYIYGTLAELEDTDTVFAEGGLYYGPAAYTEAADTLAAYGRSAGPPISPGRDSGVFAEAWDITNTTRVIADIPFTPSGLGFQQLRKPPGSGNITIPNTWGRLDDLFNPSGDIVPAEASGGTESTPGDGYKYHSYTSAGSHSLVVTRPGVVDILLVGGGGGGGGAGGGIGPGGGGGGGEPVLVTGVFLGAGTWPITVGDGGAGGTAVGYVPGGEGYQGQPGESTTFLSYTARGGAGGGGRTEDSGAGGDGEWTGGGAAYNSSDFGVGIEAGDGGTGDTGSPYDGGGGGGATQDGADGTAAGVPAGGIGQYIDEFAAVTPTAPEGGGVAGWVGGGAGGGRWGPGATAFTHDGRTYGGGGQGSGYGTTYENGVDGTGGGGGGARDQQFGLPYPGALGGDGGVYIRYRTASTGPVRSLIKVFEAGLARYLWFPERINRPIDETRGIIDLAGRGMESQASWAFLPAPAWNYGYDTTYFENFTNPPEFLTNGGYYEPLEGSYDESTPGWSAKGGATHNPYTGDDTGLFGNRIRVVPSGTHTGIQQSVDVEPGKRYLFRAWIEGSVTGQRITIGMNFDGEAASGATVHQFTASDFIYPSGSDNLLFELENANYADNGGCPGGSTTGYGTVQLTVADVTIPADCERVTVFIQSDHHGTCGGPGNQTFYVHGASLTGVGAGMPDGYDIGVYTPTTWDTSATPVISGDYSWAWKPEDTNLKRTLVGPITVEPGDYFARYAVAPPDASGQYRLVVYGGDATTIFSDTGWIAATTGAAQATTTRYVDVDFTRTDAADTIYLGILVQGSTGTWRLDEVGVFAGRPPSSPGGIITDMLQAVQAQGFLYWLTVDFDAARDSNGELWRSTSIAANFGYGGTLKAALDRIATMGYEWTIEPPDFNLGYHTGFVLRLFNGYEGT